MKAKRGILAWISIVVAIASAVGIFFIPDYRLWFLAVMLLNLVCAALFKRHHSPVTLTVCRILVGGLFIFSSFTITIRKS